MDFPKIIHHGAINGVTGSCHELQIDAENSVLIDCGLFQGAETSAEGSNSTPQIIEFPIHNIKALLVTHC
ncbi:MAG: MBL fold metallo-hydrolase, partial [Methylococcales bacterium]|nr:MBL fold metallo-hydrolase [Methylococcales bacterium]